MLVVGTTAAVANLKMHNKGRIEKFDPAFLIGNMSCFAKVASFFADTILFLIHYCISKGEPDNVYNGYCEVGSCRCIDDAVITSSGVVAEQVGLDVTSSVYACGHHGGGGAKHGERSGSRLTIRFFHLVRFA